MKLGIANKIVLSIEVVVVSITLFLGIATFFVLVSLIEKQTFSHLESLSALKERSIESFLGDVTSEVEYMNNRIGVRQSLQEYLKTGKIESKEAVLLRIKEVLTYKTTFSSMMVLDKNGVVVLSTNKIEEGKVKTDEQYFQKSKESTYFQSYFYDISSDKPTMVVGTPVKDVSGSLLGVLVGNINVDRVSSLMSDRAGLGKTGETFLVNASNVAVTELLKEPGVALKKTIYLPQIIRCLAGQSSSIRTIDYHGDEILGYYRWLPQISSCLVSKVDYKEAMAPTYSIIIVLLSVLFGGGILMGFVGYFGARLITNPIKKLHEAMVKVREGNFDVQSDVVSEDEIGEMSESFNQMTQELKISYSGLEDKIREKTVTLQNKVEELEQMNSVMVGRELKMIEMKNRLEELEKKN